MGQRTEGDGRAEMGIYDSLTGWARKTAIRRRRVFGCEPPDRIARCLAEGFSGAGAVKGLRLLSYILFHSPGRRLKLVWRYLTDRDTPRRRQRIQLLAQDLELRLGPGSRVHTGTFTRKNCSRDLAYVPPLLEKILFRTTPFVVVQPGGEEDISSVMTFCHERSVPVFPRGAASFAFGGAVPTRNGVVLDLSPMMDILAVDAEKRTACMQPGARWADLAARLEPHGLVPLTTPTSRFSTIAGWISTGGLGLESYGFGSVHESVLALRVVRPDGRAEYLGKGSDGFKDLLGTEGQFGILTEITLRLRPKPSYSGACLLPCDGPAEAVRLFQEMGKAGVRPSHAAYFNKAYLERDNRLFSDHTGSDEAPFPERDSILLHFESREEEESFLVSLDGKRAAVTENGLAARFLWTERFFPLKAQRLTRGLLGAEVVVPGGRLVTYLGSIKKIARQYGLNPAVEIILFSEGEDPGYLVMVSFGCDPGKPFRYTLNLLLIQLLVRRAVRLGGHPYGIGIWNTPFVKSRFGRKRLRELARGKQAVDPRGILNPRKFFKIRGRFFGLTGLLFRPPVFTPVLFLARLVSPVLGFLAKGRAVDRTKGWTVPAREEGGGEALLRESAERCTSCGSCISVCPAYHITGDEGVTARAKLRMAGELGNGGGLDRSEAHGAFQCLHCGLCEEVCQTRLPLKECFLVLEEKIMERFGPPDEVVASFVEALDSRRDFLREVFGLLVPEWSPDERPRGVPVAESAGRREGR